MFLRLYQKFDIPYSAGIKLINNSSNILNLLLVIGEKNTFTSNYEIERQLVHV